MAHELPFPEMPTPSDNEEEVSGRGGVLYSWPHAGEGRHCQVPGSFPTQTLLLVASHPSDSEEGQQHPSSVTSMLKNVGWEQLEERRAKSRVTMLYRIVNDLVDIPATYYLLQAPTTRKNSDATFRAPYTRTLAYQCSFFPDSTRLWNGLPSDVIAAESLNTFTDWLSHLRLRC